MDNENFEFDDELDKPWIEKTVRQIVNDFVSKENTNNVKDVIIEETKDGLKWKVEWKM